MTYYLKRWMQQLVRNHWQTQGISRTKCLLMINIFAGGCASYLECEGLEKNLYMG